MTHLLGALTCAMRELHMVLDLPPPLRGAQTRSTRPPRARADFALGARR
jgi:hypothetical protein